MTQPDPNNPTCFEAFHELGAQKQWELYRCARAQRANLEEEADWSCKQLHRARVKLANRAALILHLWRGVKTARAWFRGELSETELGDPMPKRWACMWCGEMLTGGRKQAGEHACHCPDNPAVQRIQELELQLEAKR